MARVHHRVLDQGPRPQRVADLKIADQWIDKYQQQHTQPTKELGSLIQRRRELLGHYMPQC